MKLGGTVHQNCAARGIELEGGRTYLTGVTAQDGTLDIQGQTGQVLEKIDAKFRQASRLRRIPLAPHVNAAFPEPGDS